MIRSVYGSLATLIVASLLGCGGGGDHSSSSAPTPVITVSSSTVAFGNQLVNTASATQAVTFTNSGTATVIITAATVSGAQASEYTVTTAAHLPLYLSPNFSVTYTITFTPTARGARAASLKLTHDAKNSPDTIALTGNGVAPAISVAGPTVEFGTYPVSGSAVSKPVTLSNSGDGDLIISNVAISGTDAGDFQPSASTPITVHPNASITLNIAFQPSNTGQRTATLVFTDNTGSDPHDVVKLSGAGMGDGPAQLDNASVLVSPNTTSTPSAYPATFSVDILGSNTDFSAGATVANFGPGITVGDGTSVGLPGDIGLIQVNSPTSATAQITLDQSAAPGPRNIVIQTAGHQSVATFVVPSQPNGPEAHAEVIGNVVVGAPVHLDGSKSIIGGNSSATAINAGADTSTGDQGLAFHWTLLQVPDGSTAALMDEDSVQADFIPDLPGTYVARLDVTNGGSTISTWIVLSTQNSAPIADAGSDQFAQIADTVYLDGSRSADIDGDTLTYNWTLISAPSGSATSLSDATAVAPTLIVDASGDYLLRLDVDDGHGNTASDTVLVSTNESFPIAIAGNDQKVAVTQAAQLDGSQSHDPDGEDVTCSWVFLAKPNASSAQLSSAGPSPCSEKPSFTADQAGKYLVQLLVTDASDHSSAATTLVSTDQLPPIANAGNAQNVDVGSTVQLDGSASTDADGDTLSYSWSILSKPSASNATLSQTKSANPTFVADKTGTYVCQLVVSDGTFTSVPSTVLVSTNSPRIQITPTTIDFGDQDLNTTSASSSILVRNTGTASLIVSQINITGTNASDFDYTSAVLPVTVAPGATTTVNVTFTPSGAGSRSANLTLTHNAGGASTIPLSGNGAVPGIGLNPTSMDFGSIAVGSTSSSKPLVITNNGTANLVVDHLVKTGANGGDFLYSVVGGPDFPQTIAPGMSLTVNISFRPSDGGTRSANLIFQDASSNTLGVVGVTGIGVPPAPQISLNPTSLTFPATPTNVSSAPLGIVVTNSGSADLTISSLTITGNSAADFSLSQVAPLVVPKNGGTVNLNVTFKPTALGSRTATLEVTNNAGNATNTVPVSLTGTGRDLGRLILQPAAVGKDLELLAIGSVDIAPKSNLSITITSSDPSKLLLSPLSTDPTGANAGVTSFVGVLPANKGVNGVGFPAFWIQALASSGTAQITMSAPGYTTGIATIAFSPSGFVLLSPLGVGTDFSTQLSAADSNLSVSTAQLDASGNVVVTDQKLRGGFTTSVAVVSGTPATGTISGSPVSFQGGSSSSAAGAMKFHPLALGTTLLSATQPSGFTAPTSGASLTATVRSPAITLTPTVVGYNLQIVGNGSLNIAAPAGGLQVSISSSDPAKLVLSSDPHVAGSGSIVLQVPFGSTALPAFYIQGLASSGTATLTATAPGYTTATANVLLSPSGFVLNSPNGGGNFTTTNLSSPTTLTVSVWQLNSSFAPVVAGQIRGGVSVPVEVISGTTTTGTIIDGTVTFNAGDDAHSGSAFQPNVNCVTPCTSVLSISHTPDYATPVPGGQITATVNKPSVTIRFTESTIGQNLQIMASGALDIPAPTDLQVTITSSDPNVLLSSSPTAAGSSSLSLTVFQGDGVNSIGFPSYYIQALGNSGTVTLTISAPGFDSTTATVNLAPSGFVIEGPNGIGSNFGIVLANGNVGLTVRAAVLNPSTGAPTLLYQPVRGGFSTIVDVTSSAPGVATLAGPPLTMTGGNATGAVTLQPKAPGQTNITVITPVGYTTPSFGNGFLVTVN